MTFIRDRTNLFISYRQSYTHRPAVQMHDFTDELDERAKPLLDGVEAIELEEMPPQWLSITQQLDAALQTIEMQIGELKPLHKKNALPGFDDRSRTDKEIEALTISITKGLHRCQALVKSFGDVTRHQPSEALARMAKNIQISMAAKLQDCSTTFRQMQSAYLKALQQDELGDLPGMIPAAPVPGAPSLDDDIALSEQALERNTQQTWESAEVAQREVGITRVADTILEVADIFRDMQTMVIDQGALIDRIDYNVEHTLVDVQGASRELVKGESYQKRTQKCKVILLLVLVVVGLVLVLIFKPRHRTRTVYEEVRPAPPSSGDAPAGAGAPAGGDAAAQGT